MLGAKMCWAKWSLMTIVVFSIVSLSLSQPFEQNDSTKTTSNRPRVFSPRMDYDEWTPLGRGDPLKNDPTFDYVPPVLDRVQYWLDSQSSTEASSKRDILVLGVTAKKTSPKIPDHFLKFNDELKFTRHHHHHHHHHHHQHQQQQQQQQQQQENQKDYRKDFMGSGGAEPPKIIRATNFRNGGGISTNPLDFRNQNRIHNVPASYYPSPYYNDNLKPYTMMMPPPIQQSNIRQQQQQQYGMQTEEAPTSILLSVNENRDENPVVPRPFQTQSISDINEQSTSLSSITFDKSDLIYQSSQTYDRWRDPSNNNNNPSGTPAIWNTNDNIKSYDHYEDDHNVAASANHEVIIGQNANIIVDGDNTNNEQVVIGRKEIILPSNNKSNNNEINNQIESTKMHIVIANTSSTLYSNNNDNNEASKQVTVAVVIPSNYIESNNITTNSDKHTTIESTTFASTSSNVSGSPSKQYLTITTSPSHVVPRLPTPTQIQNNMNRPIQKHKIDPNISTTTMTIHSTNFINSMIPPKTPLPMSIQYITTSAVSSPYSNIKQEMVRPMTASNKLMSDQTPLASIMNSHKIKKMTTNSLNSKTIMTASTSMTTPAASMISTSTIRSTTDSIFSHYKEPQKSMHAPMYLIIQGHSKVKTYKPTVNKYGVPVEKVVIDHESTPKRFISKFEQFVNDNTRVASTTRRSVGENNHEVKAKEKRVEQDSLLSLVESGFNAFTASSPSSPSSSSSS